MPVSLSPNLRDVITVCDVEVAVLSQHINHVPVPFLSEGGLRCNASTCSLGRKDTASCPA